MPDSTMYRMVLSYKVLQTEPVRKVILQFGVHTHTHAHSRTLTSVLCVHISGGWGHCSESELFTAQTQGPESGPSGPT